MELVTFRGNVATLIISEPRFSTPCDMRFHLRGDKGKMVSFSGDSLQYGPFPLSGGYDRMLQRVEHRGSLISAPLALGEVLRISTD